MMPPCEAPMAARRAVARPARGQSVGTERRSSRCLIRSVCSYGQRCPMEATDATSARLHPRHRANGHGTVVSSRNGSATPGAVARPRSTPWRCLGTAATTRCSSGSISVRSAVLARAEPPRLSGAAVAGGQPIGDARGHLDQPFTNPRAAAGASKRRLGNGRGRQTTVMVLTALLLCVIGLVGWRPRDMTA